MYAILWLKGVEGGFPLWFYAMVAKTPTHSFSQPFLPLSYLIKYEATPPALWRGVDGSTPIASEKCVWALGHVVALQAVFSI